MPITFQTKTYDGNIGVFWREDRKVLPYGFQIKQEFADGTIIPKGTFGQILLNDSKKFAVCKVAKVVTGGTTTKIRVQKGSLFQANDIVMKVGKLDTSPKISSIDKSNADYDVITVNSAITGVTAGDVLQEATAYGYYDAESTDEGALKVVASGATTGQINLASVSPYNGTKELAANDYVVLKDAGTVYTPNVVVEADLKIDSANGTNTIDLAHEAFVLRDRVVASEDWFDSGSFCLKLNQNIKVL